MIFTTVFMKEVSIFFKLYVISKLYVIWGLRASGNYFSVSHIS